MNQVEEAEKERAAKFEKHLESLGKLMRCANNVSCTETNQCDDCTSFVLSFREKFYCRYKKKQRKPPNTTTSDADNPTDGGDGDQDSIAMQHIRDVPASTMQHPMRVTRHRVKGKESVKYSFW